ncbi:MAG: M23 family metallopeptidase [Acidimicrobiia bacterium]
MFLLRSLSRRALQLGGIAILVAGCVAPPWSGAGDIPCPVTGTVRFRNDFGEPRSGGRTHEGIDIFAPLHRTNIAVVGGTIDQRFDPAGGNTIWLTDSAGTRFVYMHLETFAGVERTVAAGEVIGYTGNTGNASGYHTHFEVRPNGGSAINPYGPLLEACPNRS